MKRPLPPLFLMLPLILASCGSREVTVQADLPGMGPAPRAPVADLPVRLLPYDRDAILDSLTRAGNQPEPKLPPMLLAQRDSLARTQADWQRVEMRLHAIEDTIPRLTVRVGADPAERARKLHETQRLDQEQREVKQRLAALQAQISARSQAIAMTMDSVRAARQHWAVTVLKDFDRIARARMDEAGRVGVMDTTNRAGSAVFHVDEGRWWVHARYVLPGIELYWNVPVEVTGKTTRVRLDERNAERRPLF